MKGRSRATETVKIRTRTSGGSWHARDLEQVNRLVASYASPYVLDGIERTINIGLVPP